MSTLVPLIVALPLLGAAVLSGLGHLGYSRAVDAFGLAVVLTVAGLAAALLYGCSDGPITYWFGGWKPVGGIPIGIAFVVQPLGAALALLAAVVVTASFVFSWRYFEDAGTLFHALVLVFLTALVGFSLSGDLFNMFVFFELMSVPAFALTGYRSDVAGPLQGAFAFAVTNTLAAVALLLGIALLYGDTGALNLRQIGHDLAATDNRAIVVVSFALLVGGFLVKAAAVPFHFWLADAYAVAPAPVCVLFSAVMSDVGLYAVAEIYWTVFHEALEPSAAAVRAVLVAFGTLTALVGASMAFVQRNLKRLLAFATISHLGLFLIGVGLLDRGGLAGAAVYVASDGLVKGGLFLAVGVLVYALGAGDELELHGRGRQLVVLAGVLTAGGLALAAVPPFGTFLGKSLLEEAAVRVGYGWIAWILLAAELVTGAAVLRATARIALGWGPSDDALLSSQREQAESDEPEQRERPSARLMTGVAAALVAGGLALGFVPDLAARADGAAGVLLATSARSPEASGVVALSSLLFGIGATVGAVALATLALFRDRLPGWATAAGGRTIVPPLQALRRLHSGHVGDYVAWTAAGFAALAVAFALTLEP